MSTEKPAPTLHAHWNTGRPYTADGQDISAAYLEDENLVVFVDYSRMIDNHFVPTNPPTSPLGLRNTVMFWYDNTHLRTEVPFNTHHYYVARDAKSWLITDYARKSVSA